MQEYLNKEAFSVCKDIEDNSVDLIFTSVPDMSNIQGGSYKKENENSYYTFLNTFISEATRVIKDTGFIILSQTDRKTQGKILSKHVLFINKFIENDFILKDYKIMVKDKIDKINLYRLNYCHILIFTKNGKISSKKRNGKYLNDVWVYPYPKGMLFDLEYAKLIVNTFTEKDDFVFDPFSGRGTVGKACIELDRNFICTELDKKIYDKGYVYGSNKKLANFIK